MSGMDLTPLWEYERVSNTYSASDNVFSGTYSMEVNLPDEDERFDINLGIMPDYDEIMGLTPAAGSSMSIDASAECDFPMAGDVPIPELPIELWDKIITLATDIPGILDTQNTESLYRFVTADPHGVYLENRHRATVRTKAAMSRVSRYLYGISQKFLYRHICIRSGAQAAALAYTVQRIGGGIAGPVRLELSLEAMHQWTPEHIAAMECIFRHCPNLECFSSAFCTADPWQYSVPTILSFLRDHGQRLRRLEVKVDKDVLRTIEECMGDFLEILYLVPCRRLVSLDKSKQKYVLPKVHTLAISGPACDPYVRMLELPNLRICILAQASMRNNLPFRNQANVQYLAPEPSY